MIISNETAMGYQMTQNSSETSQEDNGLFLEAMDTETKTQNTTIFSEKIGIYLDYTHYNCGEFPDSSYFAEMFQNQDFTLSQDEVVCICGYDGDIMGYCSPNNYTVFYEYAENSTASNPIMNVRLVNHNTQEAWEGTMNLNDIDPRNASKMEMVVLSAHLTGDPTTFLLGTTGFDHPTEKTDWTSVLATALAEASSSGNEILLEKLEDFMLNLDRFLSKEDNSSAESYEQSQLERQLWQEQELRKLLFEIA